MNSKIQSSMKYENLTNLNEDEIINKYEHLLTDREVDNIQILKKQIEQYEKENMELRVKVKMKLSNFNGKEQKENNLENNKEKLTPGQKLLSENIDYIPVFNK